MEDLSLTVQPPGLVLTLNDSEDPLLIGLPITSVVGAVADRFEEVILTDLFLSGQIGNRSSHFQDAVVGSRAQIEVCNRMTEQQLTLLSDRAEFLQMLARHSGITIKIQVPKAFTLDFPGCNDPLKD